MRIAVVGGGFTGCMSAIHIARVGHEVTLWEASSSLGGVLRDIETTDGTYYNGCQYFQKGVLSRMGWSDGFTEFSHEYGSITSLGNTKLRFLDDCAQPALDNKVLLRDEFAIYESALQRLQAYGPNAPQLISWAQSFGDLAKLDWRCLDAMQLSRLHFPDDEQVPISKNKNQRANELLAVSRRMRGLSAELAWLPIEGYNKFFLRLHKTMCDLGVSIRLDSPITPVFESGRLTINSRSESIAADAVVWTTNPTPLFKRMFGIRIDTPPVKMKLLFGAIRQGTRMPFSIPYYWQVFDTNSSIVRLYIYQLDGIIKYSAETFDSVDDFTAWQDLQKLMKHCGIGSEHQLAGVVKQHRYVNFSTKEFLAFEKFEADLLEHGVVPGGWQHYGREDKVNNIIPLIDHVLRHQANKHHD